MAKVNLGRVVGRSAYEEAVKQGYDGTEEEWLDSLNGTTAYEAAVKGGYTGTESEFNNILNSLGQLYTILDYINGEE